MTRKESQFFMKPERALFSFAHIVFQTSNEGVPVPVDGRNRFTELSLSFSLFQMVDVLIDTARFLIRRNSATHPRGATCKLVVRSPDGPVQG